METKNITLRVSKETELELCELMGFFQMPSISSVSRSDVIKFLINTAHKEILEDGKTIQQVLKFDN